MREEKKILWKNENETFIIYARKCRCVRKAREKKHEILTTF